METTTDELTEEDLDGLSPEERAELAILEDERLGGETLDDYILRVSPYKPPPPHLRPIIEALERARFTPSSSPTLISMPPRHAKTHTVQHAIAWWLSRRPADTCAYATYSESLAFSKSRGTRDLALAGGLDLRPDSANLGEWRTRFGGGLLSGGIGGKLTGMGVSGLMIVDDPFKNQEEAQSQLHRDKVANWFDSVVETRSEGASTFVIHTRWHEDDLIGRLSRDATFDVINLPAIAEDNDLLGRPVGEPLWPDRFGLDFLNRRKARNPYVFDSLYQGRPRPRGAQVFGPAHYYDANTTDLEKTRIVIACDPAASGKTSADYSVVGALSLKGRGDETIAYVREVLRVQMQIPDFVDQLIAFQLRHGNAPIYVEAVGGFKAIPQMLRKLRPGIRIEELIPVGDKFMRAQPAAGAWNRGRILVPFEAPWLGPFLQELAAFTGVGDRHDDQVDFLAHAWNTSLGQRSMRIAAGKW